MTDLWTRYENHLLNRGVSRRRIEKVRSLWTALERGFTVPLEEAKREHIEAFVNKLHRDLFRKEDGKPYAGWTKSDMKKLLKSLYKWLRADDEYHPPETRWIRTKINKDEQPEEKQILSIEEVRKLASSFSKPIYYYLTLALFDSGFRISELLSAKKRDLTFEPYDDTGERCFWIQCNASKTERRKVPLLAFEEDYRQLTNTAAYQELQEDDPLFPLDYHAVRMALKRRSKASLGKEITAHHLRHSSATYYARELDGDMRLLADRFGWTYSSAQLKTYIRRSGQYQRAAPKKVYANKVTELQRELAAVKEQLSQLPEITELLTLLKSRPDVATRRNYGTQPHRP